MENFNSFALRHIGLNQTDIENLLTQLGYKDLEEFSKSVLPDNIFIGEGLKLDDAMSEEQALQMLKEISKKIRFLDLLLARVIMEPLRQKWF